MVEIRVTERNFGRFQARMRRAAAAFADLRAEMQQTGDWLVTDAQARLAARNSKTGKGRLAKSLKARPFKQSITIHSALPYAGIQQHGGTILPRVRKWLAIPLRLEDKRVGLWPKHVNGRPGVRLWFQKLSANKALLWYAKGRTGGGKRGAAVAQYPRWLLLKRAKVKGRPYLVKSQGLIGFMRGLFAAKLNRLRKSAG